MATPTPAGSSRRLSDLQRSAFWIYGVTAMVMREPFGLIIRHTTEAGLGNWQVRLELLRVLVILILLARLFLISGLYFETVYMQPESGERYPRRSYPIDFLAGLAQFLVGAAATTAVGLHTRVRGLFAPFTLTIALFLLVDLGWLAIGVFRSFSAAPLVRNQVLRNLAILMVALVAWSIARMLTDPVFAEEAVLILLAVGAAFDVAREARAYEQLDKA